MARIFDVVEYANEMKDELVHRFPEEGVADLRIGSQVIVRESQKAVFFRDGKALDVFGAGRHTIATANIPLLIDFIGKAFNNRKRLSRPKCIMCLPRILLTGNGVLPSLSLSVILEWDWVWRCCRDLELYSYQIKDAQQFVTQIVGAKGS